MSILFKILINDLDGGSKYILSKFTGGTNLGVTGRLNGYAAIQREFDGMENVLTGILWGSIKANAFLKGRMQRKVMKNNPMQQHRLGAA